MDTPHLSPQSVPACSTDSSQDVDVCLEECDSDRDSSMSSPEPGQTGVRSPQDPATPVRGNTRIITSGVRHNQVGSVMLAGVHIVSLFIDGKERLCLAQISNTLLKTFSYNEIHNRRVALGITCVQCTPVQLEILRRAGAMPISSRRCGMITKREAERLVTSFLEHTRPPKLPENFAFEVYHECGWGCKGSFMPTRYNSSRAKCIKCIYCNVFFSPNKFIFHFHRIPGSKYTHPDAANFNSWRRHLKLTSQTTGEEYEHAWEDVKAMFNGGSRKRLATPSSKFRDPDSHSIKQQRLDIETSPIPAAAAAVMGMSYPYPMLPLSSPTCPSLPHMLPRAAHPAFPFITSPETQHAMVTQDGTGKGNTIPDFWKTKAQTNFYNPLSMFWSKNLGFATHEGQSIHFKNPILDMSKDHMTRDNVQHQRSHGREIKHNAAIQDSRAVILPPNTINLPRNTTHRERDNKYLSAFKPVLKELETPIITPITDEKNIDVLNKSPNHQANRPIATEANQSADVEESNVLDVESFAEPQLHERDLPQSGAVPELTKSPTNEIDRNTPERNPEMTSANNQEHCSYSPGKVTS